MHHALLVNDILNTIFGYLQLYPFLPCYIRRLEWSDLQSFLALATTCRAFRDVALDFLWVDLDDLTPLVRCLPIEAWTCKPDAGNRQVYTITRPLNGTDWETLRRYVRRVRTLRSVSSSSVQVDMEAISAFCHLPTTEPLCPGLRQLHWDDERPESLPFIQHLVGHRTTNIVVSCSVSQWTAGEWSILSSVAARCPGITDIYIPSVANMHMHETVSNILCSWSNLRSVHCGVLSEDALVHLGNLQRLESLHFIPVPEAFPGVSKPLSHAFKSLHLLSLASASLMEVTKLMLRLSISPKDIMLEIFNPLVERNVLRSSFTALEQACHHDHLQTIIVYIHRRSRSRVTLVDFSPLMCFAKLTHVNIDTCCPLELNGEDILHLASAWPNLYFLVLNQKHGWQTSLGVTPEYLVRLVQKCSLLTFISIALDTRGFTAFPVERPSSGFVGRKIWHLDVLDSTIELASIAPLAVFLSGFFSKLRVSASLREDEHKERWSVVNVQMRQILGVRKQERESIRRE